MEVSIVLVGASAGACLACLLVALLDPGAVVRLRERWRWRWEISKRYRAG